MRILDPKFRKNIWRYIFQCSLAAFSVFIILLFLNIQDDTAIIASLGATTFIMFTKPKAYAARARCLFGGYLIGIVTGIVFDLISQISRLHEIIPEHVCTVLFCALAVGMSMLLMTSLNAEHAPAAGVALGLVLNVWDRWTLTVIVAAVLMLFLMKKATEHYMIDIE